MRSMRSAMVSRQLKRAGGSEAEVREGRLAQLRAAKAERERRRALGLDPFVGRGGEEEPAAGGGAAKAPPPPPSRVANPFGEEEEEEEEEEEYERPFGLSSRLSEEETHEGGWIDTPPKPSGGGPAATRSPFDAKPEEEEEEEEEEEAPAPSAVEVARGHQAASQAPFQRAVAAETDGAARHFQAEEGEGCSPEVRPFRRDGSAPRSDARTSSGWTGAGGGTGEASPPLAPRRLPPLGTVRPRPPRATPRGLATRSARCVPDSTSRCCGSRRPALPRARRCLERDSSNLAPAHSSLPHPSHPPSLPPAPPPSHSVPHPRSLAPPLPPLAPPLTPPLAPPLACQTAEDELHTARSGQAEAEAQLVRL